MKDAWCSKAAIGLPVLATTKLDQALAIRDLAVIEFEATVQALRLARLHVLGCASVAE